MNKSARGKSRVLFTLLAAAVFIFTITGSSWSSAYAQDIPTDEPTSEPNATETSSIEVISPYFSIEHISLSDGTQISGYIINGPPDPPAEYEAERAASILPLPTRGVIAGFPSYDWIFGCSAVSGAMIAAYYDNNGYPNMYTGPTNGGVMPITDTSWPTWTDVIPDTYPNNPLVASHNGVDGRVTKGSIDDYWVSYGSPVNDPYIGNWTQHTWSDAIGDYMKTSQSAAPYSNTDGSTSFYNFDSAVQLTCSIMEGFSIDHLDGTHGRKLFYEARGYTVSDCYNQNTDNHYAGGFSLADFQAEIDAGRPVLLNLEGHSIVGYGYVGSTIYIRDTWDSDPGHTYAMPWGGSYSGMVLKSVSVVNLIATEPYLSYLLMIMHTVIADPILNGDFEAGQDGSWTEYSTNGWPLVIHESSSIVSSHSGSWHVWLGGELDETSRVSQSVLVKPGLSMLHYWYWNSSDEILCSSDYFRIKVNSAPRLTTGLCTASNTGGWVEGALDLSAYAGSTVTLMFEVTTDYVYYSYVFLDDVSFSAP